MPPYPLEEVGVYCFANVGPTVRPSVGNPNGFHSLSTTELTC